MDKEDASSASVSSVYSPGLGKLYYWSPARLPSRKCENMRREDHVIWDILQGSQS